MAYLWEFINICFYKIINFIILLTHFHSIQNVEGMLSRLHSKMGTYFCNNFDTKISLSSFFHIYIYIYIFSFTHFITFSIHFFFHILVFIFLYFIFINIFFTFLFILFFKIYLSFELQLNSLHTKIEGIHSHLPMHYLF
jgi:hypothetical protein